MRVVFLILLLSNLAAFAAFRGVFGSLPEPGHEPGRLALQIEAQRLHPLTAAELQALRDRAGPARAEPARETPAGGGSDAEGSSPAPPAAPPAPGAGARGDGPPSAPAAGPSPSAARDGGTVAAATPACLQFGDFANEAAARRARAKLAPLRLGERLAERSVEGPAWFVVYLPPREDRAQVEARVDELRRLGFNDIAVIGDNSPLRNGISVGAFRDRDLALKHQAKLSQSGFADALVTENPARGGAIRFVIDGVDPALARELEAVQREFPQQRLQPCEPG